MAFDDVRARSDTARNGRASGTYVSDDAHVLYRAIILEADKALRRDHAWLVANAERIVTPHGNPEFAAEVTRRYRSWAEERAWFLGQGESPATFRQCCEAVGADVDAALSARQQYFAVPFSATRRRLECESAPSKTR